MLYLLKKLAKTFLQVGWQPSWKVWSLSFDVAAHMSVISSTLRSFRSCNNSIMNSSSQEKCAKPSRLSCRWKSFRYTSKIGGDILLINITVAKCIILINHNRIFIIYTIHIDDGQIVLCLSYYSYTMCTKESVVWRGSQIWTGAMISAFRHITACLSVVWHVIKTTCQTTYKVGTKPLETLSINSTTSFTKWLWYNSTWLKIDKE